MPKEYVINDNQVFEKVEHGLFTSYKPCNVPKVKELTATWHGEKIPFDMWSLIMAFMKASQAKFSSETMLFLYYDENREQPWDFWVPPQETSGMTVKSKPTDPAFQTQRALYPDTMFGTVHHHCTSSAFQSGTDEADETTREGFHFTVGKLGKDQEAEVHARLTLAGIHYEFENLDMIIETDINPFKDEVDLDDNMLDFIEQYRNRVISRVPDNWEEYDFEDQFKNVHKKVWSTQPYKHHYSPTNTYQQGFSWEDDDQELMTQVKKTDDAVLVEDVVSEFLEAIQFDWGFEEAATIYYTHYESKHPEKIDNLLSGNADNEEYRRVVYHMLHTETFLSSVHGEKVKEIAKEFLDEYRVLGYRFTFKEFKEALERDLPNEDRITI